MRFTLVSHLKQRRHAASRNQSRKPSHPHSTHIQYITFIRKLPCIHAYTYTYTQFHITCNGHKSYNRQQHTLIYTYNIDRRFLQKNEGITSILHDKNQDVSRVTNQNEYTHTHTHGETNSLFRFDWVSCAPQISVRGVYTEPKTCHHDYFRSLAHGNRKINDGHDLTRNAGEIETRLFSLKSRCSHQYNATHTVNDRPILSLCCFD